MTPISLLRGPVTLAYGAVRKPLALLESRLPDSSRLRTGLETALRGADSLISPHAAQDARMSPQPQPPRQQEPRPRSEPEPTDTAADAGAGTAADTDTADPWEDSDAAREAIVEAVHERQPDVGELADPDLDVADVQAELQAKHALAEHESMRAASTDDESADGTTE